VGLAKLQQQQAHLRLAEFLVQAQVLVRNQIGQVQTLLQVSAKRGRERDNLRTSLVGKQEEEEEEEEDSLFHPARGFEEDQEEFSNDVRDERLAETAVREGVEQ